MVLTYEDVRIYEEAQLRKKMVSTRQKYDKRIRDLEARMKFNIWPIEQLQRHVLNCKTNLNLELADIDKRIAELSSPL